PELTECTSRTDRNPPLGKKLANGIGLGVLYDTFVPEDGSLWLGYVDGDVVHPDRLSADPRNPQTRLGSHICGADGRCVWDNTAMANANPALNRITPLSHSPCVDTSP
ncbi:MAG: hypothetical protein KDK91_32050, partial [Gammaproteobacteria bacterium]|nr:hypothetical protein [Gammaproteobacteria bacterium]